MKRHLMGQLIAWKSKAKRKPLILQGVRQTGKTYLLTDFGKTHFDNVHIINFEKQASLTKLFDGDLEPKQILDDLRFHLQKDIDVNKDLVIFDEIQACPNAVTSLKYFCEDLPELAVCSAGSLLGLHLNQNTFPVGKVDMLYLHPMSFTEFLQGIGDEKALEFIHQYQIGNVISEIKHAYLWERLKQYFITGGLPEIISIFQEEQDNLFSAMNKVRQKQNELITEYYADMAKHSGKVNAMHIDRTWRSVPTQLASNYDTSTSRFKFRDIIPNVNRYRQLVNVIDWLEAANLVLKIPIVSSFEQPINAYTQENLFKLMMFDIGILGAMNDLDPSVIMKYDYGTYKGYFAENFVGQQLIAQQLSPLYSWQEDRSEIEFLLSHHGNVLPIEVKSGNVTRAKSLEKYIKQYNPPYSIMLSAKLPSFNKEKNIHHLPLYLVEKIPDLW